MANCKICNNEISDDQFNNFEGMCDKCIRLADLRNQAVSNKKSRYNFQIFMILSIVICVALWLILVVLL